MAERSIMFEQSTTACTPGLHCITHSPLYQQHDLLLAVDCCVSRRPLHRHHPYSDSGGGAAFVSVSKRHGFYHRLPVNDDNDVVILPPHYCENRAQTANRRGRGLMMMVTAPLRTNNCATTTYRQRHLYQSPGNQDDSRDDGTHSNDTTTPRRGGVEQWVDSWTRLIPSSPPSTTTWFVPVLLYPALIAVSLLLLPLATSALWLVLYVGYASLGRRVVIMDDDEDDHDGNNDSVPEGSVPTFSQPPVNFISFVAALLSAGILTPLYPNTGAAELPAPPTTSLPNVPSLLLWFAVAAIGAVTMAQQQSLQNGRWINTDAAEQAANIHDISRRNGINVDHDENVVSSEILNEEKLMDLWDDKLRKDAAEEEHADSQ